MTQSFTGQPFDVANLFYERAVDDGHLDPPPGGWVNDLARWQEDVVSTQANEWTGLFVMNNQSPHGDQVALYAQTNNSGNWAAAFVADAKNTGNGTTVGAEIDGTGHIAVGADIISFSGNMDTGIRIGAGDGGHVSTGLDITADTGIVTHGLAPQMLIYNADQHVGIVAADMHLIGVSGAGTDHQMAVVLA